jgi:hypothetical protein
MVNAVKPRHTKSNHWAGLAGLTVAAAKFAGLASGKSWPQMAKSGTQNSAGASYCQMLSAIFTYGHISGEIFFNSRRFASPTLNFKP